jgi:hypothetical protein
MDLIKVNAPVGIDAGKAVTAVRELLETVTRAIG